MRRRVVVLSALLACLVALAGVPATAQDREIPVTLGFAVDGRAAWLYVGIYRGYFSQQGLHVQVFRGQGIEAAALTVDQGRFLFGVNLDISALVTMRAAGSDLKGIMVVNARSPQGLQAFVEKGLQSPKDLERLSIGLQAGTTGARLFPVFARINNVDVNKVRIIPLTSDLYVSAFMSGRIDVVNGFYDAVYQTVRILSDKQGKRLSALWFKDWGLDTYGTMVVAKDRTLRERPDVVRRFLRAAKRSWDAAKADPQRAIAMMRVYRPEVDPDIALAQWKAVLEIGEETGTTPRCANPTKIQQSVETYREAMGVTQAVSGKDVFTNEFMEWCK